MNFSLEIGPHTDIDTLPAVKDVYITLLPGGNYVETAQKAIDLINFEYRELPAYFTSSDAMSKDAIGLHDHRPGNIEREVDYEIGDVDSALKDADLVLEETYNCPEICQVQTEPHAAIAEYDAERDYMTVRASTQVPFYVHIMLAKTLKMDQSKFLLHLD